MTALPFALGIAVGRVVRVGRLHDRPRAISVLVLDPKATGQRTVLEHRSSS